MKQRDKTYKAISKDGSFVTFDYKNKAGVLSSYVSKTLGIEIPSLYFRKQYEKEQGESWFNQYFNIVKNEQVTKKCPYCNWETIDIENKSGVFEQHLKSVHGITKFDYLREHPEDKNYFALANPSLNRQFEENEHNFVKCEICGKKLSRIDWKHLRTHGITKFEYISKYCNKTVSDSLHEKLTESAIKLNQTIDVNYERFTSHAETEIKDFIINLGVKCDKNRNILGGKELDLYLPEYNIAIEYNGLKWHTEKFGNKDKWYHINKTRECKDKGVKLIHIFEDEYENNKELVLSKIRHILKKDSNQPKIAARKCKISEISNKEASDFLDKYHIQGFVYASVYLGAFYDNKLIAVMTFKKEDKNGLKWDLNRFASDYNYTLQGVGGKLFSYFVENYNPVEIKSFLDRRWCHSEYDNIYTKLGFSFIKYTPPEYRYYNSNISRYTRFHKFSFRKKILHKKYGFDINLTEDEMVEKLGYDKIWDCGLIKYVWKREEKNL